MTAFDRVVDALRDHGSKIDEHHGSDVHAQCPAHDDGQPSLHVTGIEGQTLVYCHAQCHTDDVLAELGMTGRDLFDEPAGAAYQYVDTAGELLRTVRRTPDKHFSQKVHDKTRVVLYRLPEVVQAVKDDRRVWLVEGEKDVHLLESLGEIATTGPQGSASFTKVDVSPLKGAKVRAVVDRDDAGRKWANLVAASVGPIAQLEFVEATHGKDVSDHVMAGGNLDNLTSLAIDIPKTTTRVEGPGEYLVMTTASTIRTRRKKFLWNGLIPLGTCSLMSGRGGEGKSTMSLHVAAQVTRGGLQGDLQGKPRDVLIVSPEDEADTITVNRLKAAGADLDRVHFVSIGAEFDGTTGTRHIRLPNDTTFIRQAIHQSNAVLVILDPVTALVDGSNDKVQDVRAAVGPVDQIAQDLDVSIVLVSHFNKGAGSVSNKVTGSHAWRDVVRSLLVFAYDSQNDVRVMSQDKSNYSTENESLEFALMSTQVPTDDGEVADVGRVEIIGTTSTSVEQIINRGIDPEDFDGDESSQWLLLYLDREPYEFPRKEVMAAARGEGYSERTVGRAREKIDATTITTSTFPARTMWRHPSYPHDDVGTTGTTGTAGTAVPVRGMTGTTGITVPTSDDAPPVEPDSPSHASHASRATYGTAGTTDDHVELEGVEEKTPDILDTFVTPSPDPTPEPDDSEPVEDVDLVGDPVPLPPCADGKRDDCGNPLYKSRCVRCEVEGRQSA